MIISAMFVHLELETMYKCTLSLHIILMVEIVQGGFQQQNHCKVEYYNVCMSLQIPYLESFTMYVFIFLNYLPKRLKGCHES